MMNGIVMNIKNELFEILVAVNQPPVKFCQVQLAFAVEHLIVCLGVCVK